MSVPCAAYAQCVASLSQGESCVAAGAVILFIAVVLALTSGIEGGGRERGNGRRRLNMMSPGDQNRSQMPQEHPAMNNDKTTSAISYSENRPRAEARAVGAVGVAFASCPGTPDIAALPDTDQGFEGSVTRMAAAVGVGSAPLIYVRRNDVAEIVDTLVRQSQSPGGMLVRSPALARLAIVRRSEKSVQKKTSCSSSDGQVGREVTSSEKNLSAAFRDETSGSQRAHAPSPSLPRATAAENASTALEHDIPGHGVPVATSPSVGASAPRGSPLSRPAGDTAGRRSRGGWDEEHPRLRKLRSPPPPPSPSMRAPSPRLGKLSKHVLAGSTPSTPYISETPSPRPSPSSGKIEFIPISPRATDGAEAFDDFWSAGLD